MKIELVLQGKKYSTDLSKSIDISIPLSPNGPRAWYVNPMRIEPVRTDRFIGSVAEGGDVNFRNIQFNPHGHGTHTESVGHIDKGVTSVNSTLKKFFFLAKLITVKPRVLSSSLDEYRQEGDRIISKEQLAEAFGEAECEAIVLRTIPNTEEKKSMEYSGTNPTYLEPEALSFLREQGIKHLLLDLPSVDREVDGGKLNAHRHFWFSGKEKDDECTITEMIFVNNKIIDGMYMLNLQTAPFENDATPSRPILFELND
ncbi:MAG: cyclase family protein [Flavobacteriales bacterium]|nr:cyclase family protein [Flavobacteriales bacterium]